MPNYPILLLNADKSYEGVSTSSRVCKEIPALAGLASSKLLLNQ
jgi:hypothetical protein